MTSKQVDLTRNFFALGVMFWLFERSMDPTLRWIEEKFGSRAVVAEANRRALHAGYAFGETTEIFHTRYDVPSAHLPPGTYRNVTGNEATALGCVAASALSGRPLVFRRTRSRPPRTSSTSSPVTRATASRPSRPRMRSPPSVPQLAPRTGAPSGSRARRAPGWPSRGRCWASP